MGPKRCHSTVQSLEETGGFLASAVTERCHKFTSENVQKDVTEPDAAKGQLPRILSTEDAKDVTAPHAIHTAKSRGQLIERCQSLAMNEELRSEGQTK